MTGVALLTGTVLDQTGAFVTGASVTVKNQKTGETRTATTGDNGYFVVASLKPSTYTITVQKTGFANIEFTDMPVTVGQELTLDFAFKSATAQEAVTVIGSSPVIDTSSAKIGANVSEREVQGLPVNGRQMSQPATLQAPGSQNAGPAPGGRIRFSGRAVEQNVIRYDGIDASGIISSAPGVANGENASLFKLQASLENVQEFRVESSGFTAEFGTGTGGQVSVITKSGGNDLHGSIFDNCATTDLTPPTISIPSAMPTAASSLGGQCRDCSEVTSQVEPVWWIRWWSNSSRIRAFSLAAIGVID